MFGWAPFVASFALSAPSAVEILIQERDARDNIFVQHPRLGQRGVVKLVHLGQGGVVKLVHLGPSSLMKLVHLS